MALRFATTSATEDVVVSARKRVELLQDVPGSVAVIDGPEIAGRGITSIQDLTDTLPGVTFAQGGTTDRQFIRGIGSGDNPSLEQSAGVFIDDVYYGRSRSSQAVLFDVERVEVLKGPQIAYFGNNVIAGALNVLTREPGQVLSADALVTVVPRFGRQSVEAAVDLPMSSVFGMRIATFAAREEGWINDVGTGEHVPHSDTAALRDTLLWKPTDQLTARLKLQYSRERERGGLPIVSSHCPQARPFPSPTGFCAAALGVGAGSYADSFTRATDEGQATRLTTQDYVGTLTLDRGAFTVTSVTAYTNFKYELQTDLDLTPVNLLSAIAPEQHRQVSQELRIASDSDRPSSFMAGIYYQQGRVSVQDAFNYGFLNPVIASLPPFAPLQPFLPLVISDQFRESQQTVSAFGEMTQKIAPGLSMTGTLRFSREAKDFVQTVGADTSVREFGPVSPFPGELAPLAAAFAKGANLATVGTTALERSDSHWSPSVSLLYSVNDGVVVYARYDEGFKAGGFNGADLSGDAAELPFSPEKVDSFEIGSRSHVPGGRLRLDVDLFRSSYRDLQLAGIEPTGAGGGYVNRVRNAGGVVSQGIDVVASILILPQLHMSLSGTYLDAHYTRYPNATATALQTLGGSVTQDLSGQPTPFAPRISADWRLTCSLQISSALEFRFENRLYAQSRVFLDFNNDPNTTQRGYARDDITMALAGKSGWEMSITGQNLSDRTIRTYGTPLPVTLGSYAFINEPPRSVLIFLKYAF